MPSSVKSDKLALTVVGAVFLRSGLTFVERVFLLWPGLWKIMTAILHQHGAVPTAPPLTHPMMQSASSSHHRIVVPRFRPEPVTLSFTFTRREASSV